MVSASNHSTTSGAQSFCVATLSWCICLIPDCFCLSLTPKGEALLKKELLHFFFGPLLFLFGQDIGHVFFCPPPPGFVGDHHLRLLRVFLGSLSQAREGEPQGAGGGDRLLRAQPPQSLRLEPTGGETEPGDARSIGGFLAWVWIRTCFYVS